LLRRLLHFFLAFIGLPTPIMMAIPIGLPLPSLARHLPAALHLAGVGQPSQGLNAFFVAMIFSFNGA